MPQLQLVPMIQKGVCIDLLFLKSLILCFVSRLYYESQSKIPDFFHKNQMIVINMADDGSFVVEFHNRVLYVRVCRHGCTE